MNVYVKVSVYEMVWVCNITYATLKCKDDYPS